MQAAVRPVEVTETTLEAPISGTRLRTPAVRARSSARAIEWPTIALALVIHAAWLLLTLMTASLPWWVVAPIGAFLVAWHGSLQHETIHGHPTRSRRINAFVGSMPLSLWLPYGIYRTQHLAHHRVENLTDPIDDPESFYVTAETWAAAGPLRRAWLRLHTTLVGRLVFGPLTVVLGFLEGEARRIVRGDRRHLGAWAVHLVSVAALVAWLELVCHVSVARYVLLFVYPGMSLSLLRSYAEHRPADTAEERVAIVEAGKVASLLFLNNNLHVVHHDEPALAWYEIPARYQANRAEILAANGGYRFASYAQVIARYAFRSKDSPLHPSA